MRMYSLGGMLLLAACGRVEDFSDLQTFMDEVRARPGAEVEPVPTFEAYEGFIYSAASRRSPFQQPMIIDTADGGVPAQDVEPDFDRPREELEGHPLSELAMVGMISSSGRYEALIEDSFGVVHRVGVGSYLGRNFGRVTAISNSQMNLIEIVPSGTGGWVERPQTLTLQ